MSKKSTGGRYLFSVLIRAHRWLDSRRYFVVAQTPDAARARAVIEFEKSPPSEGAEVLRVWPTRIGPESVLDEPEHDSVTITMVAPGTTLGERDVKEQEFTYPQAACLDWTGNPWGVPNPEVLR